jgi:hypothetical protein
LIEAYLPAAMPRVSFLNTNIIGKRWTFRRIPAAREGIRGAVRLFPFSMEL